MNIAKNLERSAFYFPDRPALSEDLSETSYTRLNERANHVATALNKMGIQPGDHIGLCAPNSGDWLAFYFGVLKTGAVAVALSSMLKSDELSLLINHSRPRIIFSFDEKLDALEGLRGDGCLEKIISPKGDMSFDQLLDMGSGSFKAVDRDRNDTAAILYTGGTTGTPKGVMLSHENINISIQTVVFNERSNEKDRALCFLPFNHVFGQMHIMNATILSAGCLELLPVFDLERVLNLLKAGRVTKLFAVPTIFVRLLTLEGLKEKLGPVRYCFSAAASMAADVVRQWKELTGLAIYEGYGMTEAAPCVTYNHHFRHVIGSVGTEVPGVEVQIRDTDGNQLEQGQEGEICVRGRNIMKGYLNNPEGTEEAFWNGEWLRTGDVGVFNDEGYLFIVDRLKDMIITGGENVYSLEVEEVLYTRPEIQECAVIGLPDKEWGERVTAFIILNPGNSLDEDGLKTYMKSHLSSFKVPKEYHTVNDFPRSPAGKILKRELKKGYLEQG
ncbi:class I adenylate-forming enzyme family protein [Thermodesulfobacteriota bacterium]